MRSPPAVKQRRRKKPDHPEHKLQKSLVAWHRQCVRPEHAVVISIPNGDERPKLAAIRLIEEGMHPGATDLLLILPGGRVCWVEVKLDTTALTKRTDLSPSQISFRAMLLAMAHDHRVVRSIEQYEAVLEELGVPTIVRSAGGFTAALAARR